MNAEPSGRPREAQPGEVAAGTDENAAFAVGKQRVLTQDVRFRGAGRGLVGEGDGDQRRPAPRRSMSTAPVKQAKDVQSRTSAIVRVRPAWSGRKTGRTVLDERVGGAAAVAG
jgi:hypothetical protein